MATPKKTSGKPAAKSTPKPAASKTETISSPGKQPISFKKGGLHQSLGVPAGKPIPKAKMDAAAAGKFGPKAQQQANFAQNVLAKGQKTAAKNAKKGK
ncbi:MAG TPA: hypothetical protein VHX38_18715 [Pseudonocardiaceae bacterium]|jgi:hypothetical protein|nr:hypothetical protein [Pseudonocardiaceae bacterium]